MLGQGSHLCPWSVHSPPENLRHGEGKTCMWKSSLKHGSRSSFMIHLFATAGGDAMCHPCMRKSSLPLKHCGKRHPKRHLQVRCAQHPGNPTTATQSTVGVFSQGLPLHFSIHGFVPSKLLVCLASEAFNKAPQYTAHCGLKF